jgi:C4-dicarboxylate transporter, DctM subunit
MSTLHIGLLYALATFVFLFSGMPIAFAIGSVALVFMFLFMPAVQLDIVAETIYSELNSFTLLTIPLFVLMGAAIGKSRASSDLYNSLNSWLYKVPGGLGLANTLAIGSSGIPEMRKRGYSARLASGLIAAGGTLGILIPPSLTLILYGLATEQSIGKLFMAGVGPGIMLTLLFAIWVMFKSWQEKREAVAGRGT